MNIGASLLRTSALNPHAAAIYEGCKPVYDYAELAARAAQLGTELKRQHGLVPGGKVVVASPNHPDYLTALYAVWLAGGCVVPVNHKLAGHEIADIARRSRACAILAEDKALGLLRETDADPISFSLGEAVAASDKWSASPAEPATDRRMTDPAWLFYTSGTTGPPKGAVLTHRNLWAMCLSFYADYGPVTADDKLLHAAPMSHGSGLFALVYMLKGGSHIVPASRRFEPGELISLINTQTDVSMFLAPTMIRRIMAHDRFFDLDVGRIRQIFYGGAPMSLPDLKTALHAFGPRLAQLYGQGEAPMTISFLPKELHMVNGKPAADEILLSAGIPRTGVEVFIRKDNGERAAPREVGEVSVRGDVVMQGYLDDPEATACALKDGWLLTGDLGAIDGRGWLTLTGRSKDVIISGGTNIYPKEIEDAIAMHPDVEQVAVVGRPDEDFGEVVVAHVLPRTGARLTAAILDEHCLEMVARFKRPRDYVFGTIPVNAAGKMDKIALRKSHTKNRDR